MRNKNFILSFIFLAFISCKDDDMTETGDTLPKNYTIGFDFPDWHENAYLNISDSLGNTVFEQIDFKPDTTFILPYPSEGFYNVTFYDGRISTINTFINCPNNTILSNSVITEPKECSDDDFGPDIFKTMVLEIDNAPDLPKKWYTIGGQLMSRVVYLYNKNEGRASFFLDYADQTHFEILLRNFSIYSYVVETNMFHEIANDTLFYKIDFNDFTTTEDIEITLNEEAEWRYSLSACTETERIILTNNHGSELGKTNQIYIPIRNRFVGYKKQLQLFGGSEDHAYNYSGSYDNLPQSIEISNPEVAFSDIESDGFSFTFNKNTNYNFNITQLYFQNFGLWNTIMRLEDNHVVNLPKIPESIIQDTFEMASAGNICIELNWIDNKWPNYIEAYPSKGGWISFANFKASKADVIR